MLAGAAFAQEIDEQEQLKQQLETEKKAKKDSIAKIQKRIDAIDKKLNAIPAGWELGAFGTIGFNISEFNNWYAQKAPNVSSGKIGVTLNAFANLETEQHFWNNSLNTNLQWFKFDDKDDPEDDDSFQQATDVFNVTSLYGYKLSEKLALSALAEYRTTLLSNFNDPGYLDVGTGITWRPVTNLNVVVNPINYNFVFSSGDDIYESSAGAKILVDYTRTLGRISLKSNLSTFQSYEDSNLSNFTWINSFSYKLWNAIGVGFEFGLRGNKQEALDYTIKQTAEGETTPTFETVDNDLQSYWLLGLTYNF